MDIKKFIQKYWIGLSVGLVIGYFVFSTFEAPIMATIQPMAMISTGTAAPVSNNLVNFVFTIIGSITGALVQKRI